MYRALVILCLASCVFLWASVAFAGQPEARETARQNNCTPKKIEVVQNVPGGSGKTIYQVACNLPKTVGETDSSADALLIECNQSLCTLIRPISSEKK